MLKVQAARKIDVAVRNGCNSLRQMTLTMAASTVIAIMMRPAGSAPQIMRRTTSTITPAQSTSSITPDNRAARAFQCAPRFYGIEADGVHPQRRMRLSSALAISPLESAKTPAIPRLAAHRCSATRHQQRAALACGLWLKIEFIVAHCRMEVRVNAIDFATVGPERALEQLSRQHAAVHGAMTSPATARR